MIADIDQGGLGLPERDYYLRSDPKSQGNPAEIRRAHCKNVRAIGVPEAGGIEESCSSYVHETGLAKASHGRDRPDATLSCWFTKCRLRI